MTNPTKHAVFDTEHISNTYGIEDPETIRGFYVLYVKMLAELKEAVTATEMAVHDMEKIAFLSHKLKSTSFSVGAPALGHLLTDMERAAKTQSEDLEDLLSMFTNLSQETLDSINRHMG